MNAITASLLTVLIALGPAASASASVTNAPDGTIHVTCGRSQLLGYDDALLRVAISDPKVADVRVVSANQLLVRGLQPGTVSLLLWTKRGQTRSYAVRVGLDADEVATQVRAITGNQSLHVAYNGHAFLLSGEVRSSAQRELAEKVISSYGTPVVNLTFISARRDQVAIDVEIVELSRNATLNLGLTYGGGQQTGNTGGVMTYLFKPGKVMAGQTNPSDWTRFANLDFLAAELNALSQKGEAKILARPRLVTVDGGTAKFLAGGEIPIPVAQSLGTTTVDWKQFGVRLQIQPTLVGDGRIALRVAPEVSSIDYTNGLKQASFTIPGIRTRRAETEVILAPLETMMLGGLLDNEQNRNYSLLPGIGSIPVLGELFKSRNFQDNQTELAIFVTPSLVQPSKVLSLPGHLPDVHEELGLDGPQKGERPCRP